jgi:triosephosphate isomerase
MIVVNFKNYKKGDNVLRLAKRIQKYSDLVVAIPTLNIKEVSEKTKLTVYAQHADYSEGKANTGFQTLESLKAAGAKGTLLNHAEHKLKLDVLKKTIKQAKKLNLKVIVCVSNIKEIKELKSLKPYALAFEDPKLISTGKSIIKYDPKSIRDFVKVMKGTKIIPLCGAGISSREDIIESKKMGCKGVLVASAIANSKNPEKVLR